MSTPPLTAYDYRTAAKVIDHLNNVHDYPVDEWWDQTHLTEVRERVTSDTGRAQIDLAIRVLDEIGQDGLCGQAIRYAADARWHVVDVAYVGDAPGGDPRHVDQ